MGEPFSILDENGHVREDRDPHLPEADLLRLYEVLLLNRLFDQRMAMLQRQGRIGFYLGSTGEEATHTGAAYALRPSDIIVPCYREPGAFLWRGFPLKTMIAQCMGNALDNCKGRQMPVHYSGRSHNFVSISSPVGTQIPQAVGAAWAAKIAGKDDVALVFFGDGATSQGDFHVGANFAGVYKAPAILFCRNNGWAISTDFSRQTASGSVVVKAQAYGIHGVQIDGNDILAVIVATREAAERARRGEGATLIEAMTFRLGPHSTSDDPKVYRQESEVKKWEGKDPLLRFYRYLANRGLWNEEKQQALEERIKDEILSTIQEVEKAGPPDVETIFEDVYAELPWNLREQKAELLAARRSGAASHH